MTETYKGFVKDYQGNIMLPITRAELVLDQHGKIAFHSDDFLATTGPNGEDRPGLLKASERYLLFGGTTPEGGTSQGGIAEIMGMLSILQNGIKINGTQLKLYTSATNATPVNFTSDDTINIDVDSNNKVTFGLAEIHTTAPQINNTVVRNIAVDAYGRITQVSGSNDFSNTTLKNGVLENFTTSTDDIATNDRALVNKKYVDSKFSEAIQETTGSLKFGGSINGTNAVNKLTADNLYYYYKATSSFTLQKDYLHSATENNNANAFVDVGDTLIVYLEGTSSYKFVHIPSGDDITSITVGEVGAAESVLKAAVGNVSLQFGSIFNVSANDKTAAIDLPAAGANESGTAVSGYLKGEDWLRFNQCAVKLGATSYTDKSSETTGESYTLGQLKIGDVTTPVLGKKNVYTTTLTGTVFDFKKNGVTQSSITYRGGNGINVTKQADSDTLIFTSTNESESNDYLTITDNHKFKIKIGSISDNKLNNGLVDYEEFSRTISKIYTDTNHFLIIENSLTNSEKDYHYGSTALINAITIQEKN